MFCQGCCLQCCEHGRANELGAATFHFGQLLERQPCNFGAMRLLCGLLKRAGRLGDMARYLRLAVRHRPACEAEAGYRLVRGIFLRFSNEPHEAIRSLNACRGSAEWGALATEHMART